MAFEAITTERLIIRPVEAEDASALAARRSDPAANEYQSWAGPFSVESARELLSNVSANDEPTNESWWMLTVTDHDGTILGDLALRPSWDMRCVEVGYTFASASWGHGYAVEAVTTLVEHLWSWPHLTRIHATLHPDNVASAQVLERTGFRFEGRTRLSYWVGDENSDDTLYGMTRADWNEWTERPRGSPKEVTLVEITAANHVAVEDLATHHSQRRLVATVLESIADAAFPLSMSPAKVPWLRAVEADGVLVGFVMMALSADPDAPDAPEPYLWRLLVDRLHQRRSIGSRVVDLVVDHAVSIGASSVTVAWAEGRGSPAPFYLSEGFVPTGEIDDGEIVARRLLA